ncbi:ADYC domain-containing protein [Sorangium sp. So ce131]|uniref:ADYC domain-containing protein n=1 Tax=Sorangium sp. So ce131 TaxID=3133282 RepID=UPI003F60C964
MTRCALFFSIALGAAGCSPAAPAPVKATSAPAEAPGGTSTDAGAAEQLLTPCDIKGAEPKPQSPQYRKGCLEPVLYFVGQVKKGYVTGSLSEITGKYRGDPKLPKVKVTLSRVEEDKDPCNPTYNATAEVLPVYKVVDSATGKDLCEGERYEKAELEEQCHPDQLRKLEGKAFAVPGYWDDAGEHHGTDGNTEVFTLSCVTGVIAKCIHWGYAPWAANPKDPGKDLLPYMRACVHAARADYATKDSVDRAFTCDKTIVDVYDRLGIQKPRQGSPLEFEATWGEKAPSCIRRPRYARCEDDLRAAGVTIDGKACLDPADGSWPADGLVAVRSSLRNDLGNDGCPNDKNCPVGPKP